MEPIRVVLKVPRLLGEILRDSVESRADVVIVANLEAAASLEDAVVLHAPDVEIVAEDVLHVPASWPELLETHPGLRLLALAWAEHRGVVCDVLGNLAPNELVAAIIDRA